jgi:hypothetical protein
MNSIKPTKNHSFSSAGEAEPDYHAIKPASTRSVQQLISLSHSSNLILSQSSDSVCRQSYPYLNVAERLKRLNSSASLLNDSPISYSMDIPLSRGYALKDSHDIIIGALVDKEIVPLQDEDIAFLQRQGFTVATGIN